jgi:hypothetical protein
MGENRLLLIIALGGMALTLGMCTMSGAGTATGSSTFNGCMGHTHKFEVPFVPGIVTLRRKNIEGPRSLAHSVGIYVPPCKQERIQLSLKLD